MRKMILTALIAATALPIATLPTTASAQSRAEVHDSRRDVQEERRELNRAYRTGDKRDIRDERRDVRQAEREYTKDLRDYRRAHSKTYARGHWNAPFRYRSWNNGARIAPAYYGSRYVIANPWHYRLPRASGNLRYVRHYDDVLLVNVRSGRVVKVYRNFFW